MICPPCKHAGRMLVRPEVSDAENKIVAENNHQLCIDKNGQQSTWCDCKHSLVSITAGGPA